MPSKQRTTNEFPVIDHEEDFDLQAVTIDFDLLPEYVLEDIAFAAYEGFVRFMQRPDAREILDKAGEQIKRSGSHLLDPRPKKKEKV